MDFGFKNMVWVILIKWKKDFLNSVKILDYLDGEAMKNLNSTKKIQFK